MKVTCAAGVQQTEVFFFDVWSLRFLWARRLFDSDRKGNGKYVFREIREIVRRRAVVLVKRYIGGEKIYEDVGETLHSWIMDFSVWRENVLVWNIWSMYR